MLNFLSSSVRGDIAPSVCALLFLVDNGEGKGTKEGGTSVLTGARSGAWEMREAGRVTRGAPWPSSARINPALS